jgi:SNF2 family DNA or RNA helicase
MRVPPESPPASTEHPSVRGERELIDAARQERFGTWRDFRFRLIATAMQQSPAFENLLSADAARGVVPLEHQTGAVRQLLARMRGRGMLCDEVGMGKTIEAGLALLELSLRGLVRRCLVLAPPSLLGQWKDELKSKFQLEFVSSEDPEFEGWDRHERLVGSIHTAKREPHAGRIAQTPFDLVIVDEAHHLRNARALTFKLVQRLQARYLFLLTATPVQNSLEDLFNLVSLARPGQLATMKEFRRAFIRGDEPLLPRRVEELRRILREVMIRNRRSTSGVRFTRRYASTLCVEPSEAERGLYRDASALVRDLYREGPAVHRVLLRTVQAELGSCPAAAEPTLAKLGARGAVLAAACREAGEGRKTGRLLDLVREYGEKMIVFTRFQASQRQIAAALEREGIETASLHGSMRFREKQECLRRFQDSARVLVSTDVGSEGRNLQFCNAIVNFDLPWNPMKIEQRIGRVSRIGQEREVYVFNLVSAGTLEDYLLDLLHAKINMFELVIGEIDSILGQLDEERSLEELLMDLWSRGDEEFSRSLDDLARGLLDAKQRYLRMREAEDRIFGNDLGSADGPVS